MSSIEQTIDNVLQWGEAKGITGDNGTATLLTQLDKTQEELNETRDAAVLLSHMQARVLNSRRQDIDEYSIAECLKVQNELIDGIGDCAVTLILAAELAGVSFGDCLNHAYAVIKNRTGVMIDGQFVKDCSSPP